MKTLLKEMRSYKKECVLAPLFKMLEALFDLFVPLVMQKIIDTGIPGRDTGYIVKMCLVLVLLALVGLGCAVTAQYFSARAAVGFATRLRHMEFEHIQKLSFTSLDRIGYSTLITRMTSDVNQIQSAVNLTLRLFMRSPFVVFGAMIMAFTIDVKAALIFVVVIPLLMIVVFGIMLYTMPLYRRVQGALDRVTGKTRENLTGTRVIRAFRKEAQYSAEFDEANETLKKFQLFVGRISAVMNPVTYVIINIGVAVLLYTGAVRVSIGVLTQGMVVALVNYMNQILVELVKLANLIITMTRGWACGNRVAEMLRDGEADGSADRNTEGKVPVREDKDAPAVEFDHVSMHYGSAREESLSDISFSVNRGETVGIIGGTGSGKSTLAMLIPGFYPVQQGSVRVFGQDTADCDRAALRDRIGVVMQQAVLFRGSIRDNILFGNENASDEEIWQALETAQAADFVREKEGGLDALVEQEGRNFSGGQRQRLSIARAVVRRPEILILDDSASALDFATDAALRKAVSDMSGRMTVFIISQRTASVMQSDRILVLEDGRLESTGTHEELMNSSAVYREIYDSQFGSQEDI